MLNDLKLMSLAKGLMRYSGERQKVIAENVANADIPGVKAKKIEPFPFASFLGGGAQGSLSPMVTNTKHLSGSSLSRSASTFKVETDEEPYETAPNGNSIVLEEQMLYADEARRDHSVGASIYRKFSTLFKTAIGSGN